MLGRLTCVTSRTAAYNEHRRQCLTLLLRGGVSSMDMTDERRIQLWTEYEKIAMHFNDLILRLRVQALSGITAILALSGIAANLAAGPITAEQFDIICGTIVF